MAADNKGSENLAERYAAALLELADGQSNLDAVASDLENIKDLLDGSDDLRRMIASPVINSEDQGKAMAAILKKAKIGGLTAQIVSVVAINARLTVLPTMIKVFQDELARRRGEMTANVTAAKALTKKQEEALMATLKKSYGSDVNLEMQVDPSILGGLIVRVGSRMVDSSLRTKLQKLKFAMKGVA